MGYYPHTTKDGCQPRQSPRRGEWSKKYKDKIAAAKEEADRYARISENIEAASNNALRNRYTLEIYRQNNQLFHYPAKLILALESYDNAANDTEADEAKEHISAVVADFGTMRHDLEAVYSKTRFMETPNGYILDMNHHRHLAALTQDSSWLYLYEIAMTGNIGRWIDR